MYPFRKDLSLLVFQLQILPSKKLAEQTTPKKFYGYTIDIGQSESSATATAIFERNQNIQKCE